MSFDINLYAEFLQHVRSVTVYATLRKESTVYKEAYVHADQQSISLSYDGTTSTIVLPLGIRLKGSVGFPVSDPAEISLRLEVTEDGDSPLDLLVDVANDVPWSASQLKSSVQIACNSCHSLIVPSIERIWKDLPRGSWAEMLDQWYCHRPLGNHEGNSQYPGAVGARVEPGVAFVDTCHFVLPRDECVKLKVESEDSLSCSICENFVGSIDREIGGYMLFKWSILLKRECNSEWEQNQVQNFVCAQLLQLMEEQNVRKFLSYTGKLSEAKDGILLWVFNPDIKYSSSRVRQGRPRRAMKILFEKIGNPGKAIEEFNSSIEELALPAVVMTQLEQDLNHSNDVLPEPAKRFLPAAAMKHWKVALLDRFDPPGHS